MSSSILPAAGTSETFDALAPNYDELFTESLIGKLQRKSIWREADRQFRPGQRILEINCGTGTDALHLARRGVRVVACDISPRMIAVARRRLSNEGFDAWVEFHVLPTERIRNLAANTPFDGALSNFAGLNCVENLSAVGLELSKLLKPGAKFVVCVFGCCCLWEILSYLALGDVRKAFRRLGRGEVLAPLADGGPVHVWYHSIQDLKRACAPQFRLERWKGVGVAVPPSYLTGIAVRHPRALETAAILDRALGQIPVMRSLADHYLLTFKRTAEEI